MSISFVSSFLFHLNSFPLFAFFVKTASRKRFSLSPILFKDGPVVEILERRDSSDHSFAIVANLFGAVVSFEVQNFEVWQFDKNFFEDSLVRNSVVLNVESRNGRTLEESVQVGDTIFTYSISGQIQSVQLLQGGKSFDFGDHVVRKLQLNKLRTVAQILNLLNAILVKIKTAHFRHLVKTTDLIASVSFEIKCFKVGEKV